MKINVELTVEFPDNVEATAEEIEEFLSFEFGYNGSCSADNPLNDVDYEVTELFADEIVQHDKRRPVFTDGSPNQTT